MDTEKPLPIKGDESKDEDSVLKAGQDKKVTEQRNRSE